MPNKTNDINKCFDQFKKRPTPKKLGELVTLLTEIMVLEYHSSDKEAQKISVVDEQDRPFVIDPSTEKWYNLFNEAKIVDADRHKKAFEMIVDYYSTIGVTPNRVKRNKDIVVFVLDWKEYEEDGQAGLYLHSYSNRWELASLDHKKELTGMWEINGTFDEMMSENYAWEEAYPE
jgi:hypothetical protein